MLAALCSRDVDAVVDDDVVFVPLGDTTRDFEVAFTVQTANRWGIAVAKDRPDVLPRSTARSDGHRRTGGTARCGPVAPTLDYPF